jgi:hypothetical protein
MKVTPEKSQNQFYFNKKLYLCICPDGSVLVREQKSPRMRAVIYSEWNPFPFQNNFALCKYLAELCICQHPFSFDWFSG